MCMCYPSELIMINAKNNMKKPALLMPIWILLLMNAKIVLKGVKDVLLRDAKVVLDLTENL
jgi:hypothetical protein